MKVQPDSPLPPPRRGRGPGKKPPLVGTSIRLPADVVEFFRREHPFSMQAQMRAVLCQYVKNMEAITGPPSSTPEAAPGHAPQTESLTTTGESP